MEHLFQIFQCNLKFYTLCIGKFIWNLHWFRFIDDKIIYGDVKEKEEAKVAFEEAKSRGESAGHLAQKY